MSDEKLNLKYILLVDDEDEIRELIKEHLYEDLQDIKIIEAKDGSEAITKLSYQNFHCIITDLQMPKKDGADLIEKIKSGGLNKSTPIIVVSGFKDEQLLKRFNNITFIEKPHDRKTLVQLVESQLKLGRMDQRVAANVLNSFIEASRQLVTQFLNEEALIESPLAKSHQDALKGDFISVLEFKHADTLSKICFGFDKTLMAHIIKYVKEKDPKANPVDVFLMTAFKKVMSGLASEDGDLTLIRKIILNQQNDFEYSELNSLKAIVIPIKTTNGNLYLQAMHLDNLRKASA